VKVFSINDERDSKFTYVRLKTNKVIPRRAWIFLSTSSQKTHFFVLDVSTKDLHWIELGLTTRDPKLPSLHCIAIHCIGAQPMISNDPCFSQIEKRTFKKFLQWLISLKLDTPNYPPFNLSPICTIKMTFKTFLKYYLHPGGIRTHDLLFKWPLCTPRMPNSTKLMLTA
jgi:hypothetical protein